MSRGHSQTLSRILYSIFLSYEGSYSSSTQMNKKVVALKKHKQKVIKLT